MTRFENAHIAFIKRTMLPRVPDCLFTTDDIESIANETKLDDDQIQQWGKNFRARFGPDEREKVLHESNREKVMLPHSF